VLATGVSRPKCGEIGIVVVFMLAFRVLSGCLSSDRSHVAGSYAAGLTEVRDRVDLACSVRVAAFASGGGDSPGKVRTVWALTTGGPSTGSKREMRAIRLVGPPASSQGIQTLYECPSLDWL
jgi:hypothetical protein